VKEIELGVGSRISRWLIKQFARAGIVIHVLLVTREGRSPSAELTVDSRFTVGFAGPEDIPELVRVEPSTDPLVCAQRFRDGLLCFVIKNDGRIVAKMWCDLAECNDPCYRRPLTQREAYLFSAYTDPAVRGQNLAPFLRQQFYAALRALGRDSIFSCTDYFNIAARRFKRKIGAEDEALYINFTVMGRFSRRFTLKRYLPSSSRELISIAST
jgi:GNAT superfamily N-acetyltransferase